MRNRCRDITHDWTRLRWRKRRETSSISHVEIDRRQFGRKSLAENATSYKQNELISRLSCSPGDARMPGSTTKGTVRGSNQEFESRSEYIAWAHGDPMQIRLGNRLSDFHIGPRPSSPASLRQNRFASSLHACMRKHNRPQACALTQGCTGWKPIKT